MNIALLRMPTRENKVKTCTGVNTVQVCFLCQAPASEQCSHCKLVYYCSKAHYNLHRVTLQEVSDDLVHGLWRLSEEIAFSVRSKINSHSQFFRSATSTQIFRFLWFIPSLGVRSPCHRVPIHTGTFAQNSFQIDSINSCST